MDAIATITELRSKTSELIDCAQTEQQGGSFGKTTPRAVPLDWATYQRLTGETPDEGDRPPRQCARQPSSESQRQSAPD